MSRTSALRATAIGSGLALAAQLALPGAAWGHGFGSAVGVPVPAWLFAWAASIVLVASFVGLAMLWPEPRLAQIQPRRLVGVPRWFGHAAGAVGVVWFALVVLSGTAGTQLPNANLAPTAVFVLFWVGIPILSAAFGDVFRAFNPWLAIARAIRWGAGRLGVGRSLGQPLPYPTRLGRWPAVAGVLAFGWLELAYVGRDRPATLAMLAFGYALLQLIAMLTFGIETWTEQGDAFAVVFGLFSRLSPLEWRDGAVWLRPPLSRAFGLRATPGTVVLLCAMIGTTTFDALASGPAWRGVAPQLERGLAHLGAAGTAPVELASTIGLVFCVLLCGAVYWAGVRGISAISPNRSRSELARAFLPSLVPIALGYLVAHYFSLLATQGQAVVPLISDPLGTGANLFGTAGVTIDYGLVSKGLIWYVQVGALLGGHVAGLLLAHDRAVGLYSREWEVSAARVGPGGVLVLDHRINDATRSQYWMLGVMVAFSCLGLWLLSVAA